MGYAERLDYISKVPCKALDNPNLQDYEELQRFTTIWLYYMTGVRVSEGLSL